MANCTATEVKIIIDTGMSDADVGSLITLADLEISSRSLVNNLKLISMLISASLVALRDDKSRLSGAYAARAGGEFGYSYSLSAYLRKMAEDLIRRGESGTSGGVPLYVWNDPIPDYED